MQTYTILYEDNSSLVNFINSNHLKQEKNLLVQIFSGIIDEEKLLSIAASIKQCIPNANIVGTTTAGEISHAKMYEEQIILSFLVFESTIVKSSLCDFQTGEHIDEILHDLISEETKALIVFSDGLQSNAEELLHKITLVKKDLIIAGGRAGDLMKFDKTFVFNDEKTTQNGCVIASLSGASLLAKSEYMLDWKSIGKEMRITKSQANQLFEVDGINIIEIYRKYLGNDIADNLPVSGNEFPLLMKKGETEIARVPIAKLDDNSLLYGGFVEEGNKVQFSFGNIEYIKNAAENYFNKFKNIPSEAIFIYSCSARKTLMGNELELEFNLLESLAPTVGFFTYGEYFHSYNANALLNVTTTVLALSEKSEIKKREFIHAKSTNTNRVLNAMTHLAKVTAQELEDEKEEVLNALKIKSEFLANMSHEIRTPLNSILGFIDIVKENESNSENIEYLSVVQKSGKNLLNIINDILDFSKIDSNKLELELVKVNPFDEFNHFLNLFSQQASEKEIELKIFIDENVPECIQVDIYRVSQVISNLLSNAIKFTPQGGVITFKVDYLQKDNSLHVSVKDTGIGIAVENHEHIFNSFTQADSSTTRKYGGTGLGLAISHRLIALMGGELQFKSELNKGAEFYFSLPLQECFNCDIPPANTEKGKSIELCETFEGKKILLVEDNQANQLFMKVILKKLALDFDIASDGNKAVEVFKANSYDAILMDENMPNKSGMEATQEILEHEKTNNLTHTPIIALTANAIDGDRERFLHAGMDEYLTKPINTEKLAQVLTLLF